MWHSSGRNRRTALAGLAARVGGRDSMPDSAAGTTRQGDPLAEPLLRQGAPAGPGLDQQVRAASPRRPAPRSCLAYRQEDRMDVHAAAAHPYMAPPKKGARGGGGGREGAALAGGA